METQQQAQPNAASSFVLFLTNTEEARWTYATDSIEEVLGWKPRDVFGTSFHEMVHPEEKEAAKHLHYEHIKHDWAATVTYLRLWSKAKNGYHLFAFSRSVAGNFVVGIISAVGRDPGNAQAATATGGVFVLTPGAEQMAFWKHRTKFDSYRPGPYTAPPNAVLDFSSSASGSERGAILMDRFTPTAASSIMHSSNNSIIPAQMLGASLFDLIPTEQDREALKSAIDFAKSWRIHFDGTTDGIHAFCRFTIEIRTPPSTVELKVVDAIVLASSDAILLTLERRS